MKRILPSLSELFSNPFVRLRLALLIGALLVVIGAAGYVALEHYTPLEALYMAVIVLSGVGLDTPALLHTTGRLWTIGLIIFGLGTIAWMFATIIEVFVSEQSFRIVQRKRMDRRVNNLSQHYIVCGYGRIGQQIAQMYALEKVPFVVVEQDAARLEQLRAADLHYVAGDAADDAILQEAGITKAAALIAVTPTDAVNTFIVLSARGLRPDLWIVARSDTLQNEGKLYRAGANKVISTHVLGGRWMGVTALNPAVTEFVTAMTELDHANFVLHEFGVTEASTFVRQTFGAANLKAQTGALIVAVRQGATAHRFVPNPADDLVLMPGDLLIAIGTLRQQNALARLVNPQHPETILPHGLRASDEVLRRAGRGILPSS